MLRMPISPSFRAVAFALEDTSSERDLTERWADGGLQTGFAVTGLTRIPWVAFLEPVPIARLESHQLASHISSTMLLSDEGGDVFHKHVRLLMLEF